MRWRAAALAIAACGHAATPTAPSPAGSAGQVASAPSIDAATVPETERGGLAPTRGIDDERLAAIQKAMNELSPAAQACWAAVAAVRFDIEGELAAQIDIGPPNHVVLVRDTTKSPQLAACVTALLADYPWAPPLHGQSIQLPFKFTAPDGQSVIDRRLVPFAGQGKVSVAVLLDENNTNNDAASMFELAIQKGGTTGLRYADRAELWFLLADAEVSSVALAKTTVHRNEMMFVPKGAAREVAATAQDVHAVVVVAPGGREGAARAGALPTREVLGWRSAPRPPIVLRAGGAGVWCPDHPGRSVCDGMPCCGGAPPALPLGWPSIVIFAEPATIHEPTLSAEVVRIANHATIPEHVHERETELLYVLEGSGTMTVAGTELAIGPTSVVQVPPKTKHSFTATANVTALQIYTPAGPEQRFKK